ncbi:hypothetical protein J2S43_005960 [Catenuloplanes nepalensis]|uniref:Uncharacterized protein n=1 Tax=Catenuloplanes nepalensis TaxID=587533 RepID=A0ABT9N1S6_9ACTN|nr:hypothetical protein [Catenuloplanes nepalensis]MDP9797448.1 hypothetical protein [Catenuloplanes nepalensis]
MATTAITIEFDPNRLDTYSDSHLAMLWSLSQANPADSYEDGTAGELAERIGRVIIARWLRSVEPELFRHQGRHYYWRQLVNLATYEPPAGARAGSPEWHRGRWVPRSAPLKAGTTAIGCPHCGSTVVGDRGVIDEGDGPAYCDHDWHDASEVDAAGHGSSTEPSSKASIDSAD